MKVLAFARYDRLGPSSRLRFYQFEPYLAAAGVRLEIVPLLGEKYLRRLFASGRRSVAELAQGMSKRFRHLFRQEYDLLWIEKELFPWVPLVDEIIARFTRTPMVVDYDDAVYHLYDQHRYAGVRLILGRKIDGIMKHARIVTVGNRYLAHRAQNAGAQRVEIVPTSVDTLRYQPNRGRDENFTVGWIGTPVTEKFLVAVQAPLRRIKEAGQGADICLVGASRNALEAISPTIVKWSEHSEVRSIQSFDVGIMPLFDSPFERGKCGYKIIQCMACGIPVVASPVGVNREIIDHGENGFLAGTDDDWYRYLSLLRDDRQLRHSMGRNARTKIESKYALSQVGPLVANLLRQAVAG